MSDSKSKPSTNIVTKKSANTTPASSEQDSDTQVVDQTNSTDNTDTNTNDTTEVVQLEAPDSVLEPVVAPVVAPAAVVTPMALSHEAKQLDNLLHEYTLIMEKSIVTHVGMLKAIQYLVRASQLAVSSTHDDVRDQMLQYHLKYRNSLMEEKMALRGITSLKAQDASMVMTVYSLFRNKTIKRNITIDQEKAVAATSRRLVVYLETTTVA